MVLGLQGECDVEVLPVWDDLEVLYALQSQGLPSPHCMRPICKPIQRSFAGIVTVGRNRVDCRFSVVPCQHSYDAYDAVLKCTQTHLQGYLAARNGVGWECRPVHPQAALAAHRGCAAVRAPRGQSQRRGRAAHGADPCGRVGAQQPDPTPRCALPPLLPSRLLAPSLRCTPAAAVSKGARGRGPASVTPAAGVAVCDGDPRAHYAQPKPPASVARMGPEVQAVPWWGMPWRAGRWWRRRAPVPPASSGRARPRRRPAPPTPPLHQQATPSLT